MEVIGLFIIEKIIQPFKTGRENALFGLTDISEDRQPCPFHGFIWLCSPTERNGKLVEHGEIWDQEGNACGLAVDGDFAPCGNKSACWNECKVFNHEANMGKLEVFLDSYFIFPKELRRSANGCLGMPLRTWFESFMVKHKQPPKLKLV